MKSDTIYRVRTRRDVLILHHDKLKVWQAHELLKWIRDHQARTCVIVEPAGEEPQQALPEKKDERAEGSVVLKTGNQNNASFMGTQSRSRLPWKHRNSFRRRRARGARDGTANANDKSIVFVKPELRLDLWYIVTCVKISSTQSVLVGMMRSLGSWHLTYCPDCTPVVE